MIRTDTFTARDRFIPEVLKGAADEELSDETGDKPSKGHGANDDTADGELADRKDAVVEPEDGAFHGQYSHGKQTGVGKEQLKGTVSHRIHERSSLRDAREETMVN